MAITASLHQLFERQVLLHPNSLALVSDYESITYLELNRRANQLGWRLRSRGIGADCLVGVLADRSIAMVVAILAILKAGAAFLPLNPDQFAQQLAVTIEEAPLDLMLVQSGFTAGDFRRVEQLYIDFCIDDGNAASISNLPYQGMLSDLACVIYTYGSGGRLDRVLYEHSSVSGLLLGMRSACQISLDDRFLLKAPLCFNVSFLEFFLPLVSGAHIVLARAGFQYDLMHLAAIIQLSGITATSFTSSQLQLFLEHKHSRACRSLKHLWCCGEIISPSLQTQFYDRLPGAQLHYFHIHTDSTIQTAHWHSRQDGNREPVTIVR